ncbi:MAG: rod shape-determining protein MreD [Burkholderiaceae bacterium]|nr:rod shape-determining protein MreD [Burkholderiaceae bacterium]
MGNRQSLQYLDRPQLLLPVNPRFVWTTLFIALLINMLPFGRVPWMPDFLALTIVFWGVHQNKRVGVGTAFFLGVLMDVQQAALLGQHALIYTLLGYFAVTVHRRLLWFRLVLQAIRVFPLFLLVRLIELGIRMLGGDTFPGWSLLLAPVIEAVLWLPATWLLLAPQRRAPEPDANRPL